MPFEVGVGGYLVDALDGRGLVGEGRMVSPLSSEEIAGLGFEPARRDPHGHPRAGAQPDAVRRGADRERVAARAPIPVTVN